jgi:hypothetical protein
MQYAKKPWIRPQLVAFGAVEEITGSGLGNLPWIPFNWRPPQWRPPNWPPAPNPGNGGSNPPVVPLGGLSGP